MTGTSSVFVYVDERKPLNPLPGTPLLSDNELHLQTIPQQLTPKPAIDSDMALEKLQQRDPPRHGDLREVISRHSNFVYVEPISGWVELPN